MFPTLTALTEAKVTIVGRMISRATGASAVEAECAGTDVSFLPGDHGARWIATYEILRGLSRGGYTALPGDALRIERAATQATQVCRLAALRELAL